MSKDKTENRNTIDCKKCNIIDDVDISKWLRKIILKSINSILKYNELR